MNRLSLLKNRHVQQRAVLVANGPSLNQMSLAFLQKEFVFGLNKIFLGLKNFGFYPRYYVAVNPLVIQQSQAEIAKLNCVKFLGSQGVGNLIAEDALTYILNTSNPPARFCHDITLGVHEGWTVTYAALQIAYYLGFREVIIIGMDHRYHYTGSPNAAMPCMGPDVNHFHANYFADGQIWHNPDLAQCESSYTLARQQFENDGRRIIDCTVNGACTVFEKQDYREYFRLTND